MTMAVRTGRVVAVVAGAVALLLLANCAVIGVAMIGSDGNALAAVQAYLDGRTRQVAPPRPTMAVPPQRPIMAMPPQRVLPDELSYCALPEAMPTPRQEFVCVLLDGLVHCIAGNGQGGQATAVHEVYDLAAARWSTAAPLPDIADAPAGAVLEGKIYVLGGNDRRQQYSRAAWCYDPRTDSWTRLPDLPEPLCSSAAAGCRGEVYAFGGQHPRSARQNEYYVYTPARKAWRTVPLPAGVHTRAQADVLTDGDSVYWIGGIDNVRGGVTDAVDILDAATGQWQKGVPLPEGRLASAAALLGNFGTDTEIVIVGGWCAQRNSRNFPAAATIVGTPQAGWREVAPLPDERFRAGAVVDVDDNMMLVFGGLDLNSQPCFDNAVVSWREYRAPAGQSVNSR